MQVGRLIKFEWVKFEKFHAETRRSAEARRVTFIVSPSQYFDSALVLIIHHINSATLRASA